MAKITNWPTVDLIIIIIKFPILLSIVHWPRILLVFFESKLILILSLICVLQTTIAEITREQFLLVLTDALEHDWDFETDRIDVEIKRVELDSSKRKYSGFKLDLELSHEIENWERWRTTTSNSPYTRKQWHETSAYKIITSKQFLNNPSKLSLSFKRTTPWNQYERYKSTTFYDNYQTQDYESYIEIEWKIPLMRHTNSASDLKSYRRNLLDLKDQKIAYLENQEAFVYERLNEFYEVALMQEQLRLINRYIQQIESIPLVDTEHALSVKRTIFDFQNNYDAILKNKNALTKELSLRLDYPEFIHQKIISEFQSSFQPVKNLRNYLKKHNRALRKIEIDRHLKAIDIAYYENQTQPDFDLYLNASHLSDNGNTLSTEFDDTRNDYGVAIEFKLPIIGHQSSKTSLAIAKLNLQKIDYKYERKYKDLFAEIESIEQSLQQAITNINSYISFIQSSINNRIQEAENYQEHTSSIQDYIQAIENEFEAYHSQLKAKVEFQKELLKYDNLLDRLLVEKNQSP